MILLLKYKIQILSFSIAYYPSLYSEQTSFVLCNLPSFLQFRWVISPCSQNQHCLGLSVIYIPHKCNQFPFQIVIFSSQVSLKDVEVYVYHYSIISPLPGHLITKIHSEIIQLSHRIKIRIRNSMINKNC